MIESDVQIPFRKSTTGNFLWENFHVLTSILLVLIFLSPRFEVPCLGFFFGGVVIHYSLVILFH